MDRLAPETIRAVPEQYQGIYVHGIRLKKPQELVFLSGQIGVTPDGQTLSGFEDQCIQAMNNVEALLEDVNLSTANILRVVYYVTNKEHLHYLTEVRQKKWNVGHAPAVTTLVVAGLAAPDLLVEIEVTAGC